MTGAVRYPAVSAAPAACAVEEVEADPVALKAHRGIYANFVNLLDVRAVGARTGK